MRLRLPPALGFLRRPKRFSAEVFAARERFRPDYERIARFLVGTLDFESAYDLGCANGFLLDAFARAGKAVGGVELAPEVVEFLPERVRPHVEIGDFAGACGSWDLVCSVEVAEHIHPRRSRELVETVARLARRWIYFTAAPPGQSGRGHINCRPRTEWLAWFATAGWRLDAAASAALEAALADLEEAPWLRANGFILRPAAGS